MGKIRDNKNLLKNALTLRRDNRVIVKNNINFKGVELAIAYISKQNAKLCVYGVRKENFDKTEYDEVVSEIENEEREKETKKEREWIVFSLAENITHRVAEGEDFNVTVLNFRVDSRIWSMIKEFMYYVKNDEDMEGGCDFSGENYRGWAVHNVAKVEEIIKKEAEKVAIEKDKKLAQEIINERKASEERAKAQREEREIKRKLLIEIENAFENAEYIETKEQITLEGEEIENLENKKSIHGTGQYYVIEEKFIWRVQNNGMDGDDWSRNNIRTGGAGAIGVRVPYSAELEEKIRRVV